LSLIQDTWHRESDRESSRKEGALMKRTPLLISSLLLILTSCLATASVPSLLPFNPAWTAADVKSLIAAGVDVNARDESGSTPLIEAARWSNDPEVIQVLIDAGADIHARDELGFDVTALVAAAMSTVNPEVVRALVTAGADVNARDALPHSWRPQGGMAIRK